MKESSKETHLWKKYPFSKQFKDLWYFAQGHHTKLVVLFIFTIIVSLISLIPTYLYGKIIEDLTAKNFIYIYYFLGAMALTHVIYQIIDNIITYHGKILSSVLKNETADKSFTHLFKLDYEFYENNPLGQTLQRLNTGANSVQSIVKILYRSLLIKTFGVIFATVLIFSLDLYVGLFSLLVLGLFMIHQYHATKGLVSLEVKVHDSAEKTFSKVINFMSNIQLVKFLNLGNKLRSLIRDSYQHILKNQKNARRFERIIVGISKLIFDLSSVMILTYLAYKVINQNFSIGSAVMIYGFFIKLTGNINTVWANAADIIKARTGMYRLSLIFDNKPSYKEPKFPKKTKDWEKISFNDISFTYPSNKVKVFEDLNLEIKKGEKVAIVGLSGSGKSTLAKLLMRLYLPNKGDIEIGNNNIKDIGSNNLYDIAKIVPQDNELMNTSILENLQIVSKDKLNKKEIETALKNAAAYEFVKSLPEKINTIVGPNGMKISGGEKQRLCLARALITNPEILVLDEATSHLDVVNEKIVHEALHNLPEKMTVIAITHRITSLNYFDRIIVMNKGKIVGEGTHKELLRKNKQYKTLYEHTKREK